MNLLIKAITPTFPDKFPAFDFTDTHTVIYLSVIFLFTLITAYFIGSYSANKFKKDEGKSKCVVFILAAVAALVTLCFFGCTLIAIKGILLFLIMEYAAFSDISTRECDDFVHLMILIAAFIGTDLDKLPMMFVSAMCVAGVMLLTALITKSDIGGADIKFAASCAFALGFSRGIFGLVVGLTLAVIVNAFKDKKKSFPMIPYLVLKRNDDTECNLDERRGNLGN